MAHYEGSYQRARTGSEDISGLAIGFTLFASMLMILIGSFHFISGFVAVLDDTFYVVRNNYALELDVTTWGWIHIFGGIIVAFAGVGLLSGSLAARMVAIVIALLSAIWNFFSIPYYPVWAILQIAVAIGVIWALTLHGGDLKEV